MNVGQIKWTKVEKGSVKELVVNRPVFKRKESLVFFRKSNPAQVVR